MRIPFFPQHIGSIQTSGSTRKKNSARVAVLLLAACASFFSSAETTVFAETVLIRSFFHFNKTAGNSLQNATTVPQELYPTTAGTLISPAHVGLLQKSLVSQGVASARFCEGMLYKSKYVITAASCSDFFGARQVEVLARTTSANGIGGVTRDVARITIHPQWNPATFENNVAVWELSSPVSGIDTIPIATTPTPSTGYVQSSSWISSGLFVNSLTLLRSRLALTDPAECNRNYNNTITSSMLCAGLVPESTTACAGQEGGPLYRYTSGLNYELVGINSFGKESCALKGFSTVYTRVSSPIIRNFIIRVAGQ